MGVKKTQVSLTFRHAVKVKSDTPSISSVFPF